jgi:hypothetical protein
MVHPLDAYQRPGPKQGKPKRIRFKNGFIAGPLSLPWFSTAARLPKCAITVGLALWFLKNLRKSNTVKLQPSITQKFNIPKPSVHRGLSTLEAHGLVLVERYPGRSPLVTILKVNATRARSRRAKKPRERKTRSMRSGHCGRSHYLPPSVW